MKLSKEKIEEIKNQVRRCLVEDSRASSRKIAEQLGYDHKFICRLKKKIHAERAKRFDNYTVNTILATFQDKDYEFCKILWDIVGDSKTSIKDKIAAIKELRSSNKDLFDKMADAGIFTKKLGELVVDRKFSKEEQELLNKAIELDYGKPNKHSKNRGQD